MIVSGIGMVFGRGADTGVCEAAAESIVTALGEAGGRKKPFITVISTTGVGEGPRDVPILYWPLYHVLLPIPHKDKRAMERIIVKGCGGEGEEGKSEVVFGGFTIVRPTLLTSGAECAKGVRAGREGEPAVGYTISRNDVGKWILEEVVKERGEKWRGEKVSLTA